MLASFTVTRTFNKLRATLVVDCTRKEADVILTYDRRIRHIGKIAYHEVSTPEMAEQWFGRPYASKPELGNLMEGLEHQFYHGYGIAA